MVNFSNFLALHDLLDLEQVRTSREWQPLREGVEISYLYQEPNGGPSAALIYYHPDASVPRHRHTGYEHIFILSGEQRDQNGSYTQGSLLIHKSETSHQIHSPDGCLALAIWQRPVDFENEE